MPLKHRRPAIVPVVSFNAVLAALDEVGEVRHARPLLVRVVGDKVERGFADHVKAQQRRAHGHAVAMAQYLNSLKEARERAINHLQARLAEQGLSPTRRLPASDPANQELPKD